jgi:hypothetical protein
MCYRGRETVTVGREISIALVDLGVFPIRDIPWRLKSAQDVLMVANLVLERLSDPGSKS